MKILFIFEFIIDALYKGRETVDDSEKSYAISVGKYIQRAHNY